MPDSLRRTKLTIHYSRNDKKYLDELLVYLKPLERMKAIEIFVDSRIGVGMVWDQAIKSAIEEADVALLLVSQTFFASDYIIETELPLVLTAVRERELALLSLILEPCQFEEHELARYQAVNDPSRPLSSLRRNGRLGVYKDAAKLIDKLVRRAP